jgi:hypothetical protein
VSAAILGRFPAPVLAANFFIPLFVFVWLCAQINNNSSPCSSVIPSAWISYFPLACVCSSVLSWFLWDFSFVPRLNLFRKLSSCSCALLRFWPPGPQEQGCCRLPFSVFCPRVGCCPALPLGPPVFCPLKRCQILVRSFCFQRQGPVFLLRPGFVGIFVVAPNRASGRCPG